MNRDGWGWNRQWAGPLVAQCGAEPMSVETVAMCHVMVLRLNGPELQFQISLKSTE